MVKIQKQKKQFGVTIPKDTASFINLKAGEEVLLVPTENKDILIKRKNKNVN